VEAELALRQEGLPFHSTGAFGRKLSGVINAKLSF
jgi:hypothetical protein